MASPNYNRPADRRSEDNYGARTFHKARLKNLFQHPAKEYGTQRYAEGASLAGKQFILVEDVVSSGGAIIDAMAMLKTDGFTPNAAVCVIDRLTGGKEALDAHGLRLYALFDLHQIVHA